MRTDIIQTKIKEIEENIKIIRENPPETFDDFSNKPKKESLNSPHLISNATYNLIVAIEG